MIRSIRKTKIKKNIGKDVVISSRRFLYRDINEAWKQFDFQLNIKHRATVTRMSIWKLFFLVSLLFFFFVEDLWALDLPVVWQSWEHADGGVSKSQHMGAPALGSARTSLVSRAFACKRRASKGTQAVSPKAGHTFPGKILIAQKNKRNIDTAFFHAKGYI